jgi:hypothetical protein
MLKTITFNGQVFDGDRRLKVESTAGLEKEENDTGEEQDREQKQGEGP